MNEDYSIEQLEKTFKIHHESDMNQRREQLEKFKENNPDSEIPSHFFNDFSISQALHVICKEINKLKIDKN